MRGACCGWMLWSKRQTHDSKERFRANYENIIVNAEDVIAGRHCIK